MLIGGSNRWVPTSGANVPPGAFPGGESEDGEPLFVGRVNHEGSLTVGKVPVQFKPDHSYFSNTKFTFKVPLQFSFTSCITSEEYKKVYEEKKLQQFWNYSW